MELLNYRSINLILHLPKCNKFSDNLHYRLIVVLKIRLGAHVLPCTIHSDTTTFIPYITQIASINKLLSVIICTLANWLIVGLMTMQLLTFVSTTKLHIYKQQHLSLCINCYYLVLNGYYLPLNCYYLS